LSTDGSVQVADPPTQGYGVNLINTTKPGLNDPRVRRALDLALDRDALAEAFGGQGYDEWSSGPFPKTSPWYVPPDVAPKFDPDEARRLLQEYGQPVKFTYKSVAFPQDVVDALRASVQYWNDVGFDATLQVIPDTTALVTDVVLGNYDMASFANPVTYDPDSMTWSYFRTGGARNFEKYSNPEMDAALDLGRRSNDPAERKQAYTTFQRLFRSEMPIVMSSFGRIFVAGTSDLTGLDPIAFFPSRTVGVAA
jgi:peptide/nickel transport system substrate-binding protein